MKSHIVEAIAVLADLPEDRQAAIARAILDYATEEISIYRLRDEERAEVLDGLAEIDCGGIAGDDDVAKAYQRLGL
jgi:hypothetical protein